MRMFYYNTAPALLQEYIIPCGAAKLYGDYDGYMGKAKG